VRPSMLSCRAHRCLSDNAGTRAALSYFSTRLLPESIADACFTGSPAGACHRAAHCADPVAGDDCVLCWRHRYDAKVL
jgi:hypothetical protein